MDIAIAITAGILLIYITSIVWYLSSIIHASLEDREELIEYNISLGKKILILDKHIERLDNTINKLIEVKEINMACKRGGARKSAPKKSVSKGGCKKGCRK